MKGDASAWIRELRAKAGLSQEAFAERVGTLRETVAKWESGVQKPSFAYMRKIQEAFANPSVAPSANSRVSDRPTTVRRNDAHAHSLDAFLSKHGERISFAQAERLRRVRFRVDKPGTVLSVEDWEAVAEELLGIDLGGGGGTTGGGSATPGER